MLRCCKIWCYVVGKVALTKFVRVAANRKGKCEVRFSAYSGHVIGIISEVLRDRSYLCFAYRLHCLSLTNTSILMRF